MKGSKLVSLLMMLLIVAVSLAACGAPTPTATPEQPAAPVDTVAPAAPANTEAPAATVAPAAEAVTLTLGSWRVDDAEAWGKILDAFHAKYPNITVKFDPTNPPDYNATLQTQMQTGTGPDLLFVRSFATGQNWFQQGFAGSLKELPGLTDTFSAGSLAPWSTDSGEPFAVPIAAVSHGIFYNQDLFAKQGIAVPATWEDLMAAAKKLKDAGITPFSNGVKDEWDINEIVWMGLVPSAIGGRDGRLDYLTGKTCFNDAKMIASFQQIADLKPYLPAGFAATSYSDSEQLFVQGKAAMMFDGSWSISTFEKSAPDFKWSVFAIPAPAGKDLYIPFHVDAAIGYNPKSKNIEAAKTFLAWLETKDFSDLFANNVPGFFPMGKNAPTISDPVAANFVTFNSTAKGTDIRFTWEKLMDPPSGQQSAYAVANAGEIAILKGEKTPQQAADDLQTALAAWYAPAQSCKK